MSSLPSVRSKDIYDTDQLKPIEFVHERFFNNISLAKGWRESVDGLLNYSLDIVLPVKKGDAPITLAYSPFVSVPFNADPTCHPSNFVFAKTVANNTVRIYAMDIPNPNAMLPVTISMKQINTNEGTTNGTYNPSSGNDFNIEKTSIQVKGTSFIVPIDENGYTIKETELEMNVSAYKGSEKIKAEMGNIESKDVMFNLDGTPIETVLKDKATAADKNKVKFSFTNLGTGAQKDTVGIFITIPKGVLIKDRMAYFIFPISAVGDFFARSTLYTDKSDEVITSVKRYEIGFPKLSRTTGNIYFSNGVAVGPEGFEVTASEISTNNVRSDADGILKIYGKKSGKYKELSAISVNGTTNIVDPSFLNGYTDLKLEFYTSSTNKKVYEDYTGITFKGKTVYIKPSHEYLIPTTNNDGEFILPEVSVSLLSKIAEGAYEPFYGDIVVKDSAGLTITSKKNASNITIPSKAYKSSDIPTSYSIEVKGAKGEITASRFISILKQGDAEIPFFMDITPSTLVIPTTPDGDLGGNTYDFTAKMMKGAQDVSNEGNWKFEVVTKDPDLKIKKKEGTKNVFTVVAFTGSAISKVIKIEATLDNESYAREIVVTKLKQNDSVGNYTFVKWGVAKVDGETGEVVIDEDTGLPVIEFTVDVQGDLPPGEIMGDYYGVASTDVDSAPTDPDKYKWIQVENGGAIVGEQGPPGAAFYIDGDTIVKQNLSVLDEPILTPRVLSFQLVSLGEAEPLTVTWEMLKNGAWERIHDVESSSRNLILDTSTGLFDFNNKLSIRAVVESTSSEAGEVLLYYSYINCYLIYNDSPTYFARLRTNEPTRKPSYVFPIDAFGNTVAGTAESGDPLGLLADVYKGTGKLKYWHEPIDLIEGEDWEIANQPINLIPNGWDSFKPYGYEGEETKAPLEVFDDGYKRNLLIGSRGKWTRWSGDAIVSEKEVDGHKVIRVDVGKEGSNMSAKSPQLSTDISKGGEYTLSFEIRGKVEELNYCYLMRSKGNNQSIGWVETGGLSEDKWLKAYKTFTNTLDDQDVKFGVMIGARETTTKSGDWMEIRKVQVTEGKEEPSMWTEAWEDLPDSEKPVRAWDNMAVHMTPLGNGLTRIQTWGGTSIIKLRHPNGMLTGITSTFSVFIDSIFSPDKPDVHNNATGEVIMHDKEFLTFKTDSANSNAVTRYQIRVGKANENLDFIASYPKIVEGSTPALTVLKEPYPADSIREGWVENLFVLGKVNNLAVAGTDKIAKNSAYRGYTFPVKPGEEYTLSRSGEISSNRFRVIFTEEEPEHDVQGFGYISNEQNEKTFTVPEKANYMLIYLSNNNEEIRHAMRIKLEKGEEQTFWTKALEDCRPEELTNTKIRMFGGSEKTYLRKKGIETEENKEYGYGVEVRNSGPSDISIGSDIDESIIPKNK